MSPLANLPLCAAGTIRPAPRQTKGADKPEAHTKAGRSGRGAPRVFLSLILVAVIVIFGFLRPVGKLFRNGPNLKTGMGAAGAQPPIPRSGQPLPNDVFQAQAQLQTLQRPAAQEDQLLRVQQQRLARQARLMGQPALRQQQWANGQLERSVFQQYGNASGARRQLDWQLAMKIVEIERTCKLTDAQKKKLQLAGRGDIKRFFDRYEEIKRKTETSEQDEQAVADLGQDISALNLLLFQAGIFHDDSLLIKSLPNTLTDEQFAQYDASAGERRAARHRECIERAVATLQRTFDIALVRLGKNSVMREQQRQDLITLMTRETKPSPKPGNFDTLVLIIQLGHIPQQKLKRVFDQDQLEVMNQQLAEYQQLEPMLKQAGLIPDADDRAEDSGEQAASGKK
jgi:hypothetical protein